MTRLRLLDPRLTILVVILGGCSAGVDLAPRAVAAVGEQSVSRALERAIADPEDGAVHLWVRNWVDGRFVETEVFGRGVGIWNRERTFEISSDGVSRLLGKVAASGFAEMPASFGGAGGGKGGGVRGAAEENGLDAEGEAPVRLVREVELNLGNLQKRVEQLDGGEESSELRELVEAVLATGRELSASGEGAVDLAEGLDKLVGGRLPPEVLRLSLHDKPELSGTGESGFLMHLRGRSVEIFEFKRGQGYAAAQEFELSHTEFEALASELRDSQPARLPNSLYSPRYVDLILEILDHRVATQARQFAGISPSTHGEVQRDFDTLLESLNGLQARLRASVRP